jgi:hypothetical protein
MDYPDRPGWKIAGTSKDAAQAITGRAKTAERRRNKSGMHARCWGAVMGSQGGA